MKYLLTALFISISMGFGFAKNNVKATVFPTDSYCINDACLSEHGSVLVCTDNNTLKAFSVAEKQLLATFTTGHSDKILCVALSSDSTMVASGGGDSIVVICDFVNQRILQKITFATGKITAVKFSPDSKFVLFGCSNSRAYLFDLEKRKMVHEFVDQDKDITSVAYSSDGKLIGIAGADKRIRIYSTVDYHLEATLKGHSSWVRAISFYDNGKRLISCGDDKCVIRWNISDLKNPTSKKQSKLFGWILSVDVENENNQNNMYVFGNFYGLVEIDYVFGSYIAKLGSPVSKVLLVPNSTWQIRVAVATLGSGLMLIDAADMLILDKK